MAEPAATPGGFGRRFLRHGFSAVAGMVAFAGTCWGIGRALPFPEVPALGPKYRHVQAHGTRYDVLFIGSSRFYHQIIPAQFDHAVQEASGQKLRSFNCAYDAVWPPESYYFLRQVLALHPPRLKWVVIDAMRINPNLKGQDVVTERDVYWHDFSHTWMALQALQEIPGLARARRKELAMAHLSMFAQRMTNLGRGHDYLKGRLEFRKRREGKKEEWEDDAGFFVGSRRGLNGSEAAAFNQSVQTLTAQLTPADPGPTFSAALQSISAEVRAAGYEPIFVTTPTVAREEFLASIPGGAKFIPLSDPRRYPSLYRPDFHYDSYHLNERGALEFTSLLAREFCQTALSTPR